METGSMRARAVGIFVATSCACALALVDTTAHAGPQDIPPPEEETSAPPTVPVDTAPSEPLTERFHVEGSFLVDVKNDVMIDNDDSVIKIGTHNGHGPLLGGEGFVSYRLTTSFHLGVGARYLQSSRTRNLNAHVLQLPLRLTWITRVYDGGSVLYGLGGGFAHAWLTPASELAVPNAVNGAYVEARVGFIQRVFATFDVLVSVTGWAGPFISNDFGAYGLTLGLGVRFGA
jgi:hypothetical protein